MTAILKGDFDAPGKPMSGRAAHATAIDPAA
jgi:hypothetical protein